MKIIITTIMFTLATTISSASYADSTWYTLRPDPESAAIDGFYWRKKCTAEGYGYGYDNPGSMINGYKNSDDPGYSLSVKDVKDGDVIVQTTITRINIRDTKYNEVTKWYRGKDRCEKFSLKERMTIEQAIEDEKQKRANKEQETQRIKNRYK